MTAIEIAWYGCGRPEADKASAAKTLAHSFAWHIPCG